MTEVKTNAATMSELITIDAVLKFNNDILLGNMGHVESYGSSKYNYDKFMKWVLYGFLEETHSQAGNTDEKSSKICRQSSLPRVGWSCCSTCPEKIEVLVVVLFVTILSVQALRQHW